MAGIEALRQDEVREALRLLGDPAPPVHRASAVRRLRDLLTGYGTVRSILDHAPGAARDAFTQLVADGPATVEALLGRGWWGHGRLPAPLDWLQRRALVVVDDEARVHASDEARRGFVDLTPELPADDLRADQPGDAEQEGLRVEPAGCVVVAADPDALDRAVAVQVAQLRTVAPTVAVSARSAPAVVAALRSARVPLARDQVVAAAARAPALPGTVEEAVGPKAVRSLLERAVTDARQLRLQYYASSRGGAATERVVDPWRFADDLLVGYCHLRRGERTFAVDRIGRALLLPSTIDQPAPPHDTPS